MPLSHASRAQPAPEDAEESSKLPEVEARAELPQEAGPPAAPNPPEKQTARVEAGRPSERGQWKLRSPSGPRGPKTGPGPRTPKTFRGLFCFDLIKFAAWVRIIFVGANFWDAHNHLHFPAYDSDRGEVLSRAVSAGVKMISVGTQLSSSGAAVEFAKNNQGKVWASVGFHPGHFAENWHHDKNEQLEPKPEAMDIKKLEELAAEREVVAIGECGLDYFRLSGEGERERQKEAFASQIEMASRLHKPLMIHCRNAFADLIEILREKKGSLLEEAGAIHFFSGSAEDAAALLELGFSFTFGGVITFARDYDQVIGSLPLGKIISETDAPYVAPAPYRGKRNEPAFVVEVVRKLAELKGVPPEEAARAIDENVRRVFKI